VMFRRKTEQAGKRFVCKIGDSTKKYIREFRVDDPDKYELKQEIKVEEMFQPGDRVDVTGISKGKGFAGVIKRFGNRRGKETHGSMYHRRVGSMEQTQIRQEYLKVKNFRVTWVWKE